MGKKPLVRSVLLVGAVAVMVGSTGCDTPPKRYEPKGTFSPASPTGGSTALPTSNTGGGATGGAPATSGGNPGLRPAVMGTPPAGNPGSPAMGPGTTFAPPGGSPPTAFDATGRNSWGGNTTAPVTPSDQSQFYHVSANQKPTGDAQLIDTTRSPYPQGDARGQAYHLTADENAVRPVPPPFSPSAPMDFNGIQRNPTLPQTPAAPFAPPSGTLPGASVNTAPGMGGAMAPLPQFPMSGTQPSSFAQEPPPPPPMPPSIQPLK
jgi:hypothetical protein